MSRKVVVIGASPNETRYSHMASAMLGEHKHEVVPLGIRGGKVGKLDIVLERPELSDVDTVTLYVGPGRQSDWLDYILSLSPKRVIFNPGTENPEIYNRLEHNGISHEESCTLLLLKRGVF